MATLLEIYQIFYDGQIRDFRQQVESYGVADFIKDLDVEIKDGILTEQEKDHMIFALSNVAKNGKYTICFDTLCGGYEAIKFDDEPCKFDTESEALAEMASDPDFYDDCFVVPFEDLGHKTIFMGEC